MTTRCSSFIKGQLLPHQIKSNLIRSVFFVSPDSLRHNASVCLAFDLEEGFATFFYTCKEETVSPHFLCPSSVEAKGEREREREMGRNKYNWPFNYSFPFLRFLIPSFTSWLTNLIYGFFSQRLQNKHHFFVWRKQQLVDWWSRSKLSWIRKKRQRGGEEVKVDDRVDQVEGNESSRRRRRPLDDPKHSAITKSLQKK